MKDSSMNYYSTKSKNRIKDKGNTFRNFKID